MDLEETLQKLAPNLLRFCTAVMGHIAEGEDLAQEALTALVRFWSANGPPESPAAFVYTVARRQAGRFRRRWLRLLPLEAPDRHPGPAADPMIAVMEKQRLERALQALAIMPRRERLPLLMILDGTVRPAEAALALGISLSAFKMRVHRARQRLLHRMEEGDGFPERDGIQVRSGS